MPTRKVKLQAGDLILNTPFEEPSRHWVYDRKHLIFTETEGRRSAGYVVATPDGGHDDPGQFIPLPLVNQIRERVKAWRMGDEANGIPQWNGVTGTTRRLLEHWCDPEQREAHQFFFCQLEAIETLIWLTEASPADRLGIEIPGDGGSFQRWCSKMATGSGKTIVMAMLIAWQALNKATYGNGTRFGKHFLVIAPGLTVRNRLQVLVPDAPGNYYDEFSIVPGGEYEKLRQATVRIHNWHHLGWESEDQIAKRKSVDKRGALSDEAYVREVLGDAASARDWLVINDEAHHAWRVPAESKVRGVAKVDIEEATKWVGGLDRLHRARGIRQAFDFSATPFAPSGKKSSEEALFGWVVSDFGLNDAIESGLVKTPRVVVRDNGRLTTEYKSRFYHLYRDADVKDDFNRPALEHEPLPGIVTAGYDLLGADWLATAKDWKASGHPVPPVMITVANRTETAARIRYAFDKERIHIAELCKPELTLHIDSEVLNKAEEQEQAPSLNTEATEDDGDESATPVKKLNSKQRAELLRQTVDTVGQPGRPGASIQNVISVGMLSEGWDAKTVTHIMGLRAFSSQLLCEQVVGRGLRRTSYSDFDEHGRLKPEYVNIFGVPFTFLPHEDGGDSPPPSPKPQTLVEPIREREQRYGIAWPNVVRIENVYQPKLELPLERVPVLTLNAADTPTHADLAAILAGKPNLSALSPIDLEAIGRNHRLQTFVFKITREIFEQMQPNWQGTTDALLRQLIRLVEQVLGSDRIRIQPDVFNQDEMRRRVLLTVNMDRIVQHIWQEIRFANTEQLVPVFDTQRPLLSTADMRTWYTARPCEPTHHSHINVVVYDSTWEATEAYALEHSKHVDAWVKNDHLGFEIQYLFRGARRKYRPDFLIRLTNGTMLVLEVKGEKSDETDAKHRYLAEWVDAVNGHGGFGCWTSGVAYQVGDVAQVLHDAVQSASQEKV
jgi:type III restriction enzyme